MIDCIAVNQRTLRTLGENTTVHKILAIRNQLGNI
jgi:hypothetical protein